MPAECVLSSHQAENAVSEIAETIFCFNSDNLLENLNSELKGCAREKEEMGDY